MKRSITVAVSIAIAMHLRVASARGEPRVVVWPASPSVDVAPGEAEAARRGARVVPFESVRARLAAPRGDDPLPARIERQFRAAHDAFVTQRWDDMIDALSDAEDAVLQTTARSGDCGAVWEHQFQFGLAFLSRKRDADVERASRAFQIAYEVDPDRRPERSLYGPAVVEAYTLAIAALQQRAPRPMTIAATPRDARISIDCVALVETRKGRALREGFHVWSASAPGYRSRAQTFEWREGGRVTIELFPEEGDPIQRVAAAWHDGSLRASTATGRRAIVDAALAAGADVVLFVDVEAETGRASAQLLTPSGASPVVTRAQATDAAAAALTMLDDRGRIVVPEERVSSRDRDGSVLGRWWFWTGVGAAVVGAIVLTIVLTEDGGSPEVEVGVW